MSTRIKEENKTRNKCNIFRLEDESRSNEGGALFHSSRSIKTGQKKTAVKHWEQLGAN